MNGLYKQQILKCFIWPGVQCKSQKIISKTWIQDNIYERKVGKGSTYSISFGQLDPFLHILNILAEPLFRPCEVCFSTKKKKKKINREVTSPRLAQFFNYLLFLYRYWEEAFIPPSTKLKSKIQSKQANHILVKEENIYSRVKTSQKILWRTL